MIQLCVASLSTCVFALLMNAGNTLQFTSNFQLCYHLFGTMVLFSIQLFLASLTYRMRLIYKIFTKKHTLNTPFLIYYKHAPFDLFMFLLSITPLMVDAILPQQGYIFRIKNTSLYSCRQSSEKFSDFHINIRTAALCFIFNTILCIMYLCDYHMLCPLIYLHYQFNLDFEKSSSSKNTTVHKSAKNVIDNYVNKHAYARDDSSEFIMETKSTTIVMLHDPCEDIQQQSEKQPKQQQTTTTTTTTAAAAEAAVNDSNDNNNDSDKQQAVERRVSDVVIDLTLVESEIDIIL
eukprot:Pgem_evm2s18301